MHHASLNETDKSATVISMTTTRTTMIVMTMIVNDDDRYDHDRDGLWRSSDVGDINFCIFDRFFCIFQKRRIFWNENVKFG